MVVIERKLDDPLVELGRVILALGAPTKDKHGSYLRSEHLQRTNTGHTCAQSTYKGQTRVILVLRAHTKEKHGSYLCSEHIQRTNTGHTCARSTYKGQTRVILALRAHTNGIRRLFRIVMIFTRVQCRAYTWEEKAKDGCSLFKDFSTTDRCTDPADCDASIRQVLRNADGGGGGCQIFREKVLRRCKVQRY